MSDVLHQPPSLEGSPDPITSGVVGGDAPVSPQQGNITIVPPSEHRAGAGRRNIVELHDDGRVTLNIPSYPRDRGALIFDAPESSTNDDAEACYDPPPSPSLAPFKEFRPAAWSYLMLFVATQFYTMRLGNRDALSGLEAQAQLLRNIVTYIRDELRVHLPCFGNKTALQLQAILEQDPALRDAMQRIVRDMDDELAMRSIVHYLLSRPGVAPVSPANSVGFRIDTGLLGHGDSDASRSSQAAGSQSQPHRLDDLEAVSSANLDPSAVSGSLLPSFKPRLFKGQFEENKTHWTNLVWNSGHIFRDIPATTATVEELGRLVHAVVSRIHVDSPGSAPLFEGVSMAQFSALLANDPAFESAVRDLHTKASQPDYFAYCKALRLLVNHLCQKRRGAQRPAKRVRISESMPDVE